jgi:competence protein ComEA
MWKIFHTFFRTYFGFTKRESRGFLFVFPTLLLMYFIPYGIDSWLEKGRKEIYEQYIEQARLWTEKVGQQDGEMEGDDLNRYQESLSYDQAKARQDSTNTNGNPHLSKPGSPSLTSLGFHETDSLVLQVVSGIGPVLAGRIVKYRENIGGFFDPGQLLEVFGIDEELAEKIYQVFPFDQIPLHKLKLNSATLQDLTAHPYIKYGEAKVILAYREQHGAFQSTEDLLKIKIFNEEWLARLSPYLEP